MALSEADFELCVGHGSGFADSPGRPEVLLSFIEEAKLLSGLGTEPIQPRTFPGSELWASGPLKLKSDDLQHRRWLPAYLCSQLVEPRLEWSPAHEDIIDEGGYGRNPRSRTEAAGLSGKPGKE